MDAQRAYLEEYLALIAGLGARVSPSNDAWWATWLSSKNEFLSAAHEDMAQVFRGGEPSTASPRAHAQELARSAARTLRYATKLALNVAKAQAETAAKRKRLKERFAGQEVYLIKTFAYERNFRGRQFQDPFFGRLPAHLSAKRNVLTIFDPVGDLSPLLAKSAPVEDALPVHAFLEPADIFRAAAAAVKGLAAPFPESVRFRGKEVALSLKQQYQRELAGPDAIRNFCMYFAFQRISREFRLSQLLVTHENDPWERMCILAVKRASPQTEIVGYQHTTAPLALVNLFLGPGEADVAPVPHRLVTVGECTAEVLRQHGHYGSIPIDVGCALRFEPLEELKPDYSRGQGKTLLVVLDGVPQAAEMIDFVLESLGSRKDWKVVLREHPACNLADLEFIHGRKFPLGDHLAVSKSPGGPILEDIARAGAVLYWGSSAAIEALAVGRPVVYFDDGRLLSNDVLFQTTHLKSSVSRGQDLFGHLDRALSLTDEAFRREVDAAHAFTQRYFERVTGPRMDVFAR